ncbi:MAG: DUF3987 domain-containing protein, partial [Planctomycetota bacterium]
LNQNPNGLTVYRDELIGLLKSLEKEGHECDRAFYLEAWDGRGRYTYDRIGRGTIDIECVTLSIIGSIQPGPLRAYLAEALAGSGGADGLIQRFQLAVYPDVSREWHNVDRWPNTEAKNRAYEVFARLNRITAHEVAAVVDEHDRDGIPYLRFDAEAQGMFDAWRANLERRLRAEDEHDVIVAHLAKYRSLIPSLALLIHLADGHVGPVGVGPLEKAVRWSVYLESHARRIYGTAVDSGTSAAYALVRRILSGEVTNGFTARDVYRAGWSGLATREDVAVAVAVLMDLDWLREDREQNPAGGRPLVRYWVNPKILANLEDGTDKTAKTPVVSVMAVPLPGEVGKTEAVPDDEVPLEVYDTIPEALGYDPAPPDNGYNEQSEREAIQAVEMEAELMALEAVVQEVEP